MHTAKRKKLSKILFKKKIKTLVSIQTRSRLNHHYETHQYEKALYFAFMLSAKYKLKLPRFNGKFT
jgi:hypothetical protein